MNSRSLDHPIVYYIWWLTALSSSLLEFHCRLTNFNGMRGTLLFGQEKVKQFAQFRKMKSPHCWKAGWVCKDSVLTSFRNQNHWLKIVLPPNLSAHSKWSSVYYRFQSFPRRVTPNDKHTNSKNQPLRSA